MITQAAVTIALVMASSTMWGALASMLFDNELVTIEAAIFGACIGAYLGVKLIFSTMVVTREDSEESE